MKSEGWYIIIVIVFFLFIGGICGFFIKSCNIPKPIPQTSHVDTVRVKADTVKIKDTHYYALPKDTITNEAIKYPKLTIADSLQGSKEGIGYNLSVRASIDSLGVKWNWKTEFIPPDKTTIYDTTYVPQMVEVNKPWYSDTWFYTPLLATTILILRIIYN